MHAVRRGQVRAAPHVVARDVHFVLRQGTDQVFQAQAGIFGVLAFREARDQVLEGIKGVTQPAIVALGGVLARYLAQQAQILVEQDQAAQVKNVVDVLVIRIQLGETVTGGHGGGDIVAFPVRICDIHLRLLGVAAERVLRLERLKPLDRLVPTTAAHFLARFGVDFLR